MGKIPKDVYQAYMKALHDSKVISNERQDYVKWLRYYLDYCGKYRHPETDRDSLREFMNKLAEKGQDSEKQEQAGRAIGLYYELVALGKRGTAESGIRYTVWDKCRDQLKAEISVRQYSRKTYKAYVNWLRRFEQFLKDKSPEEVTSDDARAFLTDLAVREKVSASTQNQAFNALLFMYRHILKVDYDLKDKVVRAKRTKSIPVVLSRAEIDRIIACLPYPQRLVVKLLYGCGLRFFECQNLRVHCFNFEDGILTIHDGKGRKDRTLPIPACIYPELKEQLRRLKMLHERDLEAGYDGTFMPGALERKWKNASKEFRWQWFFPAKTLTLLPEEGERRRYHMHNTSFQRRLRKAVNRAGITKRVTAHTFRHSFASHLLQANFDIRTIQEMMGHSDVRTTMIYTHTVKSRTQKEQKSPLDLTSLI